MLEKAAPLDPDYAPVWQALGKDILTKLTIRVEAAGIVAKGSG